jgi:hypothetical protein
MCEETKEETETEEGDSLERGQSDPAPDHEKGEGDQDLQKPLDGEFIFTSGADVWENTE